MTKLLLSSAAAALTTVFISIRLMKRGKRLEDWFLFLALFITAAIDLADSLSLLYPDEFSLWIKSSMVALGLLPLLWILFSKTFCRVDALSGLPAPTWVIFLAWPAAAVTLSFLPVENFLYAPDFPAESVLFVRPAGRMFLLGLVAWLSMPLVFLAHTYFTLPKPDRWKGVLEVLGIWALISTQILYYGHGAVYGTIDMSMGPARSIVTVFSLGLMAASRHYRGRPSNIHVSKYLALRSVILLMVVFFLAGMALLGQGLSYLADSFRGPILTIVFIFTGIMVAVALLSETVRRKILVFLHKHFYEEKYDYRKHWQEFSLKVAGATNENNLQDIVLSFYCDTFSVKNGALFVISPNGERYECVSTYEIPPSSLRIEASDSVCRYFKRAEWVLSTRESPEFLDLVPELKAYMEVSFVVPMISGEKVFGLIFLGPLINENEAFFYEDFDLMKMLARQAASSLMSFRLSMQLSSSREMAAMGKVSTFVMHDLKNLVSNLALVSENAKVYLDDEEFREDLHHTLALTVSKMTSLISRLEKLKEKPVLDQREVDLKNLALDTASLVTVGKVEVRGEKALVLADPEEIQKVMLNLVMNGIEATKGEGAIKIRVGVKESPYFEVMDEGCGMTEDFIRYSLFKPFVTTKKKGFGIGLYQCKNIVEAHGGSLVVKSEPGRFTRFTVQLPGAARTAGKPLTAEC